MNEEGDTFSDKSAPNGASSIPPKSDNPIKMSWLARSVANTLIAADQNSGIEDEGEQSKPSAITISSDHDGSQEEDESGPNRGVKEDLNELSQTLTRQFWGVASFLAPPPSISTGLDPTTSDDATSSSLSPRVAAMLRNDFAEIGGRFRSGISRLSNNFIQFGGLEQNQIDEEEDNDDDESVIGVTGEVMAFARNIAMHPETWLDFPLFNEFEDTDDFEMSDNQQEHALAVESLLPRLAALRIELCPAHMTEGCFWKIYFVLLHSRLSREVAKLLSTPQIDEARAMLLQKLQNKTKLDLRNVDSALPSPRGQVPPPSSSKLDLLLEDPTSTPSTYPEPEKPAVHAEAGKDPSTRRKDRDLANNFSEISIHDYDDDEYGDDWLDEDEARVSSRTTVPFGNEEDVSFSDLEDDEDEPQAPPSSKALSNSSKR